LIAGGARAGRGGGERWDTSFKRVGPKRGGKGEGKGKRAHGGKTGCTIQSWNRDIGPSGSGSLMYFLKNH